MEGFSDEAKKAFEILSYGNYDLAMMLYRLKFVKDYEHMDIVSSSLQSVVNKIDAEIEKRGDPFCAIIKGIDEFWDVSLSKFIYELAVNSAYFSQMPDLSKNRLVDINSAGLPIISKDVYGIPVAAKMKLKTCLNYMRKVKLKLPD